MVPFRPKNIYIYIFKTFSELLSFLSKTQCFFTEEGEQLRKRFKNIYIFFLGLNGTMLFKRNNIEYVLQRTHYSFRGIFNGYRNSNRGINTTGCDGILESLQDTTMNDSGEN